MSCGGKSHRPMGDFVSNLTNLDETGRLQFFYHSPSSEIPVRDVLNEQKEWYKTEPYIERNAENYCRKCLQSTNIKPFLKGNAKYLFLFTRCKNGLPGQNEHLYVVGYIRKQRCERRPHGGYAVIGETKLYSFADAYPVRPDCNPRHMRKILDRVETGRILDHFEGKKNVLKKCLVELERLKRDLPEKEKRTQARECK